MAEDKKMTYTETVQLILKILDEHKEQIKSLDDRERLIQKTLERMAGEKEGKKEAEEKSQADWKLVLTVIGVVASIIFGIVGLIL